MQKIIVPTDFSNNAMKAVTYAAEIAKRSGAVIHLLHVMEPVIDKIRRPHAQTERLEEEITRSRLGELKSLKDTLADVYPDLTIETELARGSVATAILDYSENLQADLIVMGTLGASGLKEVFLGSVTSSSIGRTKIPVLAVPYEYLMEEPDAIVLATNRFEEDEKILNTIIELASLFSATVHVVAFVDTDFSDATYYIHNHKHLSQYLTHLQKAYPGISFTSELLEGKEFEETIEQYHNKKEADIIAMVTYPKSFWEKILRKSVTKKMAFHSKIPLLAIPAE